MFLLLALGFGIISLTHERLVAELNAVHEQFVAESERRFHVERQLAVAERAGLQTALTEMKHLATHDDLTGLPNRRLLADRLEHALARANRLSSKVAVMALDLDGFKIVNDSFGHAAGDALLKNVATQFASRLRTSDTLSRTGGDEFTVIAEVTDSDGAATLVSDLKMTVSNPLSAAGNLVLVSVSIGLAIYPDNSQAPDQLLSLADKALYLAKRLKKKYPAS
jgi:diguanylate cyclase (GGDEF)-like protein